MDELREQKCYLFFKCVEKEMMEKYLLQNFNI